MFFKKDESDGFLYLGCELCHTDSEIIIPGSICRKNGIYYTTSRNISCPECKETSNRIIDEPEAIKAISMKKKELEEARRLKQKEHEEKKKRLEFAKRLKEKRKAEAEALKEKELALKQKRLEQARIRKEKELEEEQQRKELIRRLNEKRIEEAKALKEKQLAEAKALKDAEEALIQKMLEEARRMEERKLSSSKSIETEFSVLTNDSEMKLMLYNYIRKLEFSFLSTSTFIIFERLIIQHSNIGELSLLCSEDELNRLFVDVMKGKQAETNLQLIKSEFNQNFLRLVKLVQKKHLITMENIAIFVTWKLLRQSLTEYYHSLALNEYGNYFNNIKELSLEKCISLYVNMDFINVTSTKNAGLLTHFLIHEGVTESQNFIKEFKTVFELLLKYIEHKKDDDFERSLLKKKINSTTSQTYSIHDIDLMTGHEFERFISELFRKMGYSTQVTKGSGDQGIDVIAVRQGRKFGIQAKCYSSAVSNKAIQEVSAGINHYKLDKGIVVTNNYYTDSAIKLASSNGIVLWDRNILKVKIEELF